MTFSLDDATARGFDVFAGLVKLGEFDRMLVRPRSTVLQLLGHELTLRRVGRLLQGAVVLGWGLGRHGVAVDLRLAALLGHAVAGGVALFFALVVLQAVLAFWTPESLEIMNTVTYGGVETAQYPLSIYHRLFRRFFIFVVPLGCVCYFPVITVLGRPDPLGSPSWLGWISPAAGFAFLAAALAAWRLGVRHYTSVGS